MIRLVLSGVWTRDDGGPSASKREAGQVWERSGGQEEREVGGETVSGREGSKGLSGPDGFPTSIFWVPYKKSSFLKETRLVFLVLKKRPITHVKEQ